MHNLQPGDSTSPLQTVLRAGRSKLTGTLRTAVSCICLGRKTRVSTRIVNTYEQEGENVTREVTRLVQIKPVRELFCAVRNSIP
jgi:hypothetical protein